VETPFVPEEQSQAGIESRPLLYVAEGDYNWKNFYSITFAVDQEAMKTEKTTDGVFPLITNLDAKTHPAKKVLEIYKFQPFLEKRHTQLKTYQEIAPVYLKKPERVVAYLHIHVMALMVSSLLQGSLRMLKDMRPSREAMGLSVQPEIPQFTTLKIKLGKSKISSPRYVECEILMTLVSELLLSNVLAIDEPTRFGIAV